MIETLAGRALAERFGKQESAREQIETLTARLPAVAACAVLEHLFGVLPLLDAFFAPGGATEEMAAGLKLGSLGLFTPTPELGWEAAAVHGEPSGAGVILRGETRAPSPASDGSIVLVRLPGPEHRLAWLDHGVPGVERRGSRLALEGANVGPGLVSQPVTLAPGGGLFRCLEAYAGAWALAAAIQAGHGVRALRRAARTTQSGGKAFSSSQLVAMDITELEIEAELALLAARAGGGLAAAAAAARILHAVAAKAAELRDFAGIELDEPPAAALTAFLGGPLMIEHELARALQETVA